MIVCHKCNKKKKKKKERNKGREEGKKEGSKKGSKIAVSGVITGCLYSARENLELSGGKVLFHCSVFTQSNSLIYMPSWHSEAQNLLLLRLNHEMSKKL